MNLTVHADGAESDSNYPAGLQSGAGPAFDKTFVQLDEFLVSSMELLTRAPSMWPENSPISWKSDRQNDGRDPRRLPASFCEWSRLYVPEDYRDCTV